MKISTRARYGLHLMIELALHYGHGFLYLKDIAKSGQISEKYLSQLVIPLKTKGLINSGRGVHGGYMLAKDPKRITIKEIVEPLEGSLNLVDCMNNPSYCRRNSVCLTRNVWALLSEKVSETLDNITLNKLVQSAKKKTN